MYCALYGLQLCVLLCGWLCLFLYCCLVLNVVLWALIYSSYNYYWMCVFLCVYDVLFLGCVCEFVCQ